MEQALKMQLLEILKKQSSLLDEILVAQKNVHECVVKRVWLELENGLEKMRGLSDEFAELDGCREKLSSEVNFNSEKEIAGLVREVKAKLLKSKIENKILNEYIFNTQKFLKGIFEEVLPERRNTVYSHYGKIVKPELHNVVIDQIV